MEKILIQPKQKKMLRNKMMLIVYRIVCQNKESDPERDYIQVFDKNGHPIEKILFREHKDIIFFNKVAKNELPHTILSLPPMVTLEYIAQSKESAIELIFI